MQNRILSLQDFAGTPVRVYGTPESPLFVAADVCRVLEISNPRQAIAGLDDDEKGVSNADTLGGQQVVNVVTESGLYHLIFKSRKREAKAFRRWVTEEVLPAIRKTGSYQAEQPPAVPGTYLDALKALTAEVEARERMALENASLNESVERMAPKEEFFDAAMSSKQGMLVRDAAKLINSKVPGGMGERRLFRWLRENRWLMPGNRPYQSKIDAGYMTMTERPVLTNSHGTILTVTPRITQRGLVSIFNKISTCVSS